MTRAAAATKIAGRYSSDMATHLLGWADLDGWSVADGVMVRKTGEAYTVQFSRNIVSF
jgi:hypothetical protein